MGYVAVPYLEDEHRAALERFWVEDFAPRIATPDERMRWLYDANPEGRATTCIGVTTESSEPVGCATCFPRAVVVDGSELRAGVSCDFAVNRKNRVGGAAVALQRFLARRSRDAGYAFLYGFPNGAAVAVCKRVGYATVGTTRTWIKPLHSGYKLEKLPYPIATVGARVVDAALGAFDAALAVGLGARFSCEERALPDARFDDLWRRARPLGGVAGRRSASYLAWRYTSWHPPIGEGERPPAGPSGPAIDRQANTFFCLTRRAGGALAGYAVYHVSDHHAFVQDIFAEDQTGTIDALLVHLARHLRQRGVYSLVLSYLGPARFGRRLARLGFFERPGGREMLVYTDPAFPTAMRATLLDPESWLLLDGELDI